MRRRSTCEDRFDLPVGAEYIIFTKPIPHPENRQNIMKIVDLTRPFDHVDITRRRVPLHSGSTDYTGVVYEYSFDSMQSTYIDIPGHIEETDDGLRADTIPLSALYRLPADVIRMDLASEAGAVTAGDLTARLPRTEPGTPALIVNALGGRNPRDINERSVYLDDSAVDWIIGRGYKLLISDIYESRALLGVFKTLFGNGISTVCEPVNLFLLTADRVLVSAIPCPIPGVTQLPCRLFAEF